MTLNRVKAQVERQILELQNMRLREGSEPDAVRKMLLTSAEGHYETMQRNMAETVDALRAFETPRPVEYTTDGRKVGIST